MNRQEIEIFMARQDLFRQRSRSAGDTERMAGRLVARDRDLDDRRYCLECRHLRGAGPYRCSNAQAAGVHAELAHDLVVALHRCCGNTDARLPLGVMTDFKQGADEKNEKINHG